MNLNDVRLDTSDGLPFEIRNFPKSLPRIGHSGLDFTRRSSGAELH
jgi:hypothetical protein